LTNSINTNLKRVRVKEHALYVPVTEKPRMKKPSALCMIGIEVHVQQSQRTEEYRPYDEEIEQPAHFPATIVPFTVVIL